MLQFSADQLQEATRNYCSVCSWVYPFFSNGGSAAQISRWHASSYGGGSCANSGGQVHSPADVKRELPPCVSLPYAEVDFDEGALWNASESALESGLQPCLTLFA